MSRLASLLLLLWSCELPGVTPMPGPPIRPWTPHVDVSPAACFMSSAPADNLGQSSCDARGELRQARKVWNHPGFLARVAPVLDDNGDGRADAGDPSVVAIAGTGGLLVVARSGAVLREFDSEVGDLDVLGKATPAADWVWAATYGGDGLIATLNPDTGDQQQLDGTFLMGTTFLSLGHLDSDGLLDVVTRSGVWRSGLGTYVPYPRSSRMGPIAIADLDEDGALDVAWGGQRWTVENELHCSIDMYYGVSVPVDVDGDGSVEWVVYRVIEDNSVHLETWDLNCLRGETWPGLSEIALAFGPSVNFEVRVHTIADFDNDSLPEYSALIRAGFTEGDPPLPVRECGTAVFDSDGSLMWVTELRADATSGECGGSRSAADLDGDGRFEILGDGNRVLSGLDGSVVLELPGLQGLQVYDVFAADVGSDGHQEILAVYREAPPSARFLVSLFEGDPPFAGGTTIWNQHAFFGTNVMPDGVIPEVPYPWWKLDNSYRSSGGQDGLTARGSDPTVRIVETCDSECDRGRYWLTFQVGNQGDRPTRLPMVADVWVQTAGERRVMMSHRIEGELAPGRWEAGVTAELRVGGEVEDVGVTVRPDGWILSQCDASNDTATVGGTVCAGW